MLLLLLSFFTPIVFSPSILFYFDFDLFAITCVSVSYTHLGKKVALNIERPEPVNPQKRLVMEHVTCVDKEGVKTMDDAGFTAYSGEILGIEGIAGSGQKDVSYTHLTAPGGAVGARHIIKIKSHAQKGKLVAILRWLYISVAQLKLAVSSEFLQQRDQPFKAIPQLLQLILRKVLKPSHRTL